MQRLIIDLAAGTPPRLAEQFRVDDLPWPAGVRTTDRPCECVACAFWWKARGGLTFIRTLHHEVEDRNGHATPLADGDWVLRLPGLSVVRSNNFVNDTRFYRAA